LTPQIDTPTYLLHRKSLPDKPAIALKLLRRNLQWNGGKSL